MNILNNKYLIKLFKIYNSYIYNLSDLTFAQSKAFVTQIGKHQKIKIK